MERELWDAPTAIPPDALLTRIGVDSHHHSNREAREEEFARRGLDAFRDVASVSPESPITVLDFGCGSGRILRWWAHERPADTIVGCDIHEASIDWMRTKYPERVRLFVNSEVPPLPEEDDTFNVIYCGSVFSHLTDWAAWLLELLRVLKPGGTLVASIHGRGFWQLGVAGSRGVPWDDDGTGIIVERAGESFHTSWGPAVYVSEWWLRRHWGAAMNIIEFHSTGFGLPDDRERGQGWVVGRKRPGVLPSPETIAAASDDPRELPAALRALDLAYDEIALVHIPEVRRLWHAVQESSKVWEDLAAAREELEAVRASTGDRWSDAVTNVVRRIRKRRAS